MTIIPPDFSEAVAKAGLTDFFADCTASHQREYLKWIGEAKKSETRSKRIVQAVKMLTDKRNQEDAGKKQPKSHQSMSSKRSFKLRSSDR
jgi:uncharacterized protein YdeI (YjbR/CyaY-like superfamily)